MLFSLCGVHILTHMCTCLACTPSIHDSSLSVGLCYYMHKLDIMCGLAEGAINSAVIACIQCAVYLCYT